MKNTTNKLEEIFMDITFAEERPTSPAKEVLKDLSDRLEETFVAIAFAEEREFKTEKGNRHKHNKSYGAKGFEGLCAGKA